MNINPDTLRAVAQVLAENSDDFNVSQNQSGKRDEEPAPSDRRAAPNRKALEVAADIIETYVRASVAA